MKLRLTLFSLSVLLFWIFLIFSLLVIRENWIKRDFDTTVRVQDHIPARFGRYFGYFTALGSVEVTVGLALILAFTSLVRGKILAVIGWLVIVPISLVEVFGKLFVFHPAPPIFLQKKTLEIPLPIFSVPTNFSYPSGHMARIGFLVAVFVLMIFMSRKRQWFKLASLALMIGFFVAMAVSRIYLGEHWLSDVIGGAILGFSGGLFASILIIGRRKV